MATTLLSDIAPTIRNGAHFSRFAAVKRSDTVTIAFSDGTRIAVADCTGRTQPEHGPRPDLSIGIPADDVVNLHLADAGEDGRLTLYRCIGTELGAPLCTIGQAGAVLLAYDPAAKQLTVLSDAAAPAPDPSTGEFARLDGTTVLGVPPECFLRGTRILTGRGEVAVEDLAAGDHVATRHHGLRPVRWIGTQRFDGRLAGPDHQPVRICAGAMGQGLPHTDLLVSRGHALLVDRSLVHAAVLVNDVTIRHAPISGPIEYYHLDLGLHDCVLANGIWAESYLEAHHRPPIPNAARLAAPPAQAWIPQRTCLPVVGDEDPQAATLHARLAPRLPPEVLSSDPDLHLRADGRRIDLLPVGNQTWQAELPSGLRELRLCSHATRPSMLGDSPDRRRLGVMVRAIELAGPAGRTAITPDHPALGCGWHAVESDGTGIWRWTDGNALLPARLLAGQPGPIRLILRAWHLPQSHAGAMPRAVPHAA